MWLVWYHRFHDRRSDQILQVLTEVRCASFDIRTVPELLLIRVYYDSFGDLKTANFAIGWNNSDKSYSSNTPLCQPRYEFHIAFNWYSADETHHRSLKLICSLWSKLEIIEIEKDTEMVLWRPGVDSLRDRRFMLSAEWLLFELYPYSVYHDSSFVIYELGCASVSPLTQRLFAEISWAKTVIRWDSERKYLSIRLDYCSSSPGQQKLEWCVWRYERDVCDEIRVSFNETFQIVESAGRYVVTDAKFRSVFLFSR